MTRRIPKTPRREESLEPKIKTIQNIYRLGDLKQDAHLEGISFSEDPNTVVVAFGTKKDKEHYIYASLEQAAKNGDFKQYFYSHLIPTYSRPAGKGFSYIYKGPHDYMDFTEKKDKSVDVTEEVQKSCKRPHEEVVLPSVSDNIPQDHEGENVDSPPLAKRPKVPEGSFETEMTEQNQPVPQYAKKSNNFTKSAPPVTNRNSFQRKRTAKYYLNHENDSDDEHLQDFCFDSRSPEVKACLESGSKGIDPSYYPQWPLLNYNKSSTSTLLSSTIEIDEEPDYTNEEEDAGAIVNQPQRKSYCTIM